MLLSYGTGGLGAALLYTFALLLQTVHNVHIVQHFSVVLLVVCIVTHYCDSLQEGCADNCSALKMICGDEEIVIAIQERKYEKTPKKHCQRHNGPRVLSLKLELSLPFQM